jgi:YHS domain-containing protein
MKWILTALLLSSAAAYGQTDELRQKHFNIKKGIAIEGHDPVSYFNGKPAEGRSDLAFTFRGVTYLFVNSSNLNKFKSSPEKYEPAYGGWCAYAMGDSGEKVKIDPETFKILDGRLYLFYNFWGNNTLTDWNKDERKLKQKGDINWGKFIH